MPTRGGIVAADLAVGATCVAVAAALTAVYLRYAVTVDDGLESLVVLPLAATLVGGAALLRAALTRTGTVWGVAAIWAGSVLAWAGAGFLLSDSGFGPLGSALFVGYFGGGFTAVGAVVGALVGRGIRRVRDGSGTVADDGEHDQPS